MNRIMLSALRRTGGIRYFADLGAASSLTSRKSVTPLERAALRAERKAQATKLLEQHQAAASGGSTTGGTITRSSGTALAVSRYIWYLGVGVPVGLLVWGFNDKKSPPAQFSHTIGLTGFVQHYTDELAKPAHNKLLPDWSQVCLPLFQSLSELLLCDRILF
jgi:hypothetical protein